MQRTLKVMWNYNEEGVKNAHKNDAVYIECEDEDGYEQSICVSMKDALQLMDAIAHLNIEYQGALNRGNNS